MENKTMSIETLREEILEKIKTLPEEELQRIQNVILDKRILFVPRPMSEEERAKKAAGMAILRKYKGTITRKIDVKKELAQKYKEKYESYFGH